MSANDPQSNMLLLTRDEGPLVTRDQGYFARRSSIIGTHLECHRQGHFTVCTFYKTHQAMTGAIFRCPCVRPQPFIRPGTQCLYGHEVGYYSLASETGEGCSQNITSSQIALRARNRTISRRDLE